MQKACSKKKEWLGCFPSCHFLHLTDLHLQSLTEYQKQAVPYLKRRGVSDEAVMEILIHQDLFHIAHALSLLFEHDSAMILQNIMGDHFFLIDKYDIQIDHVGRELFGPLSFYLPLLKQMAKKLGLIHLKDKVFPSTQVLKILQKHDPSLKGVTVARSYFQNKSNDKIRCLELFQASALDEKFPQKIEATEERLALLSECRGNSFLTPIDHLSLQLNKVEDVEYIHDLIHDLASETLRPYQEKISYNPGDGSMQTKVLLRDSELTSFNKIIEFVYYGEICSV